MAGITISVNLDASQIPEGISQISNLTKAFAGVEAKSAQMAAATAAATSKLVSGLQQVSVASKSTAESFQSLASAAAGVFAVFQGGGLVAGFLRDVTLTAARTETLSVVLTQVAKNAGLTSQQATAARDSIKALGITTQEASTITTRFIQNNLDLAKANQLARVAQDAAVIANQSSSEALAGLVHGILTLQPEVIRTYGLIVNLEAAYKAFAQANDRTVESLTGQEKQQIALNAVLEQGTAIAGTYSASMDTVGKQLGSLTRVIEESANVIGSNYLPILSQAVGLLKAMLEAFQSLPTPIQTLTAAIIASAAAVGTLTVAVAALTRVGQALAISSLFTGWGPVILAIGAAAAAAIYLTKVLADLGRTDPSAVLQRSIDAIDAKIKQQEHLLAVQEQANKVLIGSRADDPTTRIARTKELTASIEALRKVQEQLTTQQPIAKKTPIEDWTTRQLTALKDAKGIPAELNKRIAEIDRNLRAAASNLPAFEEALGLFRSDPAFAQKRDAFIADQLTARQDLEDKLRGISKDGAARATQEAGQSALERAKAVEEAQANSLKRQVEQVKQSADEQRRIIDEAASEALRVQGPGAVEAIDRQRREERKAIAIQEAKDLEKIALEGLTRQAELRGAVLKAEIAAAGKNTSAKVAAEEALTNLQQDTAAKRVKIEAETAQAMQGISKKTTDEQIKDARELNKLIEQTAQEGLQARISLVDEHIALIEAQVQGDVVTQQQGLEQIRALQAQRFEDTRQLYTQQAEAAIKAIDLEVAATALGKAQITQIREDLQVKIEELHVRTQTETQRFLNQEVEEYKRFVEKVQDTVGDFLFNAFSGQVKSIKDLLSDLKSFFLRILADMVASAVANPIAITIKTVVGGVVGAVAPSLGGQILQGIGLPGGTAGAAGGTAGTPGGGGLGDLLGLGTIGLGLKNLFGPTGAIGGALASFTGMLDTAALHVGRFGIEALGIPPSSAGFQVSGLGALGGLAGLGGGIYSAVSAQNMGGRVGGAIGAAGGAAALASALGLVLTPVLGPIGLALAAIGPLLGNLIGGQFAPKGPRLAVGGLGGLGIGGGAGGLTVQGDLTSQVLRQERLEGVNTAEIQSQLAAGVTNVVQGMVKAINAVALAPGALLEPTQRALTDALRGLEPINSSNAKKMQADIEGQLKLSSTSIASSFLSPLNQAFRQLETAELDTQIARLPDTTAGMVEVFKSMNTQLDELSKVANTDVLRQLSSVRSRVEDFGASLADTARVVSETIVSGLREQMTTQARALFDQPLSAQITGFEAILGDSIQALASLRATQTTLEAAGLKAGGVEGAITELMQATVDVITEITGEMISDVEASMQGADIQTQLDRFPVAIMGLAQTFQDVAATAERLSQEGIDTGDLRVALQRFGARLVEVTNELATTIVDHVMMTGEQAVDAVLQQSAEVQRLSAPGAFRQRLEAGGALRSGQGALAAQGLDTSGLQEQLNRLFESMITDAYAIMADALAEAPFDQALQVILAIPDAVTSLNPMLANMKALAQAFAPLVGALAGDIKTLEEALTPLSERIAQSGSRMDELGQAIEAAGGDINTALPLMDELRQEILRNAELQIDAIQEIAQAWDSAMGFIGGRIAELEEEMLPLATHVARANEHLAETRQRFIDLAAAGDLAEAIRAAEDYGRAIEENARRQREAILEEKRLKLEAQQAVIDGIQAQIDALEAQESPTQALLDAQRAVIQATRDAIDAKQDEMDVTRDAIAAKQEEMDVTREAIAAKQAEMDVTREAIAAVQEQMDVTREAIAAVQEQMDATRDQIEAVQEQMDVTRDAIEAVQEQMDVTRDAIEAWQEQMDVTRDAIEVWQEQMDVTRDAIEAWQEQMDVTRDAIEAVQEEMDITRDAIAAWQDQMDITREQIAAWQEQMDVTRQQIEVWQEQMDVIRKQIAVQQKAAQQQQQIIEGYREEVQARQEVVDSLRSEVESLRGLRQRVGGIIRAGEPPSRAVESIRAEIVATQAALVGATGEETNRHLERLVALNEELKNLGEQTDQLVLVKEALDNLAVLYATLAARESAAEAQLSVAELALNTAEMQLAAEEHILAGIETEIERLEAILESQQAQVEALEDVLAAQQKQADALDDVLESQQKQVDALEKVLKLQQKEVDALEDVLKSQQKQVDALEDVLKLQQKEVDALEDVLKSQQKQVDALEDVLKLQQKEVDALEDVLKSQQKQVDALEDVLKLQQKEVDALEDVLKSQQKQVDALEKVLAAQQKQVDILEKHLAAQQKEVDALEKVLAAQQKQVDALEKTLKAQEKVADALEKQVAKEDAERQERIDNLRKQLTAAENTYQAIATNTAWTQRLNAVNDAELSALYGVQSWLQAIQAGQSWEQQIAMIQQAALAELRQMQGYLAALYGMAQADYSLAYRTTSNTEAQVNESRYANLLLGHIQAGRLQQPLEVFVRNFYESPRQRGGLVGLASGLHYAQGGMVPTLLEPGESVWTRYTAQQGRALLAVNEAFPRFASGGMVPGTGDGDHVRMWLPSDSMVVNRHGTQAMGLQGGGEVSPMRASRDWAPEKIIHIHNTFDLRSANFKSTQDAKEIIKIIDEWARKRGRSNL